jgi:2-dehydro-3-deoxyphosphogluconate aldolase / (4S)-4-hydroxy-2-oxoglutarate aldolase
VADVTDTPFARQASAQRVVPVLTVGDVDVLPPLIEALQRGGATCIEMTLRTAEGIEHIRWIASHHPDLCVGAGTVLSAGAWDAAADAGAQFIVSPCATPALYAKAQTSSLPWLPGVQTASEIAVALESGHRTLRFFPAVAAGGAELLAGLAPVFPEARFCPTGGVDGSNCDDFLALPSVSWVAGSWLTPDALVTSGQWQAIADGVRAVCAGGN